MPKFDLSQFMKPEDIQRVSDSNTARREVVMLPARKVFANEMNFYDVSDVSDLIDSILIHGLLEPVVVRPSGDGDSYIIISGHRRHKAWMTILDDNLSNKPGDFLNIPCFVAEPKDELIEELMLIQANSATRVLTPAEVAKQAERVEDIIYRLKEQGHEFPGRMRDYVAKLCNVSATKLAKLKVIRNKLIAPFLDAFNAAEIPESTAYTIAQQSASVQQALFECLGDNTSSFTEMAISTHIGRIAPMFERRCDLSDGAPCGHITESLKACYRGGSFTWRPCTSRECCSGCHQIASCENFCPKCKAEHEKAVKQRDAENEQRKTEAAEAAAKRKEEYEKEQRDNREMWRRVAELRKEAGLSVMEAYADIFYDYDICDSDVEDIENNENSWQLDDVDIPNVFDYLFDIKDIARFADKLNTTLDYLFLRTDSPHAVALEELNDFLGDFESDHDDNDEETLLRKIRWEGRGVCPPEKSLILTYNLTNAGPVFRPAEWSGSEFHAPGNPKKVLSGFNFLRWIEIPLFDERCEFEQLPTFSLQAGMPSATGPYAAKFECEGVIMTKLAYYDAYSEKFYFSSSLSHSIEAECIGWIPLPKDF